jgi:hypothetical protein
MWRNEGLYSTPRLALTTVTFFDKLTEVVTLPVTALFSEEDASWWYWKNKLIIPLGILFMYNTSHNQPHMW